MYQVWRHHDDSPIGLYCFNYFRGRSRERWGMDGGKAMAMSRIFVKDWIVPPFWFFILVGFLTYTIVVEP